MVRGYTHSQYTDIFTTLIYMSKEKSCTATYIHYMTMVIHKLITDPDQKSDAYRSFKIIKVYKKVISFRRNYALHNLYY